MARSEHIEPMPLKPTTIALIRQRAASHVPGLMIAREIGWSQERLLRVCSAHGIEIVPMVETVKK